MTKNTIVVKRIDYELNIYIVAIFSKTSNSEVHNFTDEQSAMNFYNQCMKTM